MLNAMHHAGLSVVDLDRSIAFYRDVLGMKLVLARPFEGRLYETILGLPGSRGKVALLEAGGFRLELFEFEHPTPQPAAADRPVHHHGLTHFCIDVTDVESEYARLEAAGVAFHCPPLDFGAAKATYARDPDGNVFELREQLAEAR